jgi:hypothetical protein
MLLLWSRGKLEEPARRKEMETVGWWEERMEEMERWRTEQGGGRREREMKA